MEDRPQPRSPATTGLAVAAVVGMMICCAVPLLVAAGVLASLGVLFDNLLVIALGAGLLGWAVARAVRTIRVRNRSAAERDRTGA